jgi:murein DD-endopeptidase MepM/ murein hydrolase activator NlpD
VLAAIMLVGPVTGIPSVESSSSILPPARPSGPAAALPGSRDLAALIGPQFAPGGALRGAGGPPAVPQALPPPARTYTTQDGDSLWSISQRHGVAMEALAAANRLSLTAPLRRGTVLAIPAVPSRTPSLVAHPAPAREARPAARTGATATHVVQSGETLWDIARLYHTSVEALFDLNDLGHSDLIKPGQRLTVSGRALPRYRQAQRAASGPARAAAPDPDETVLKRAEGLAWPSRGTLTTRFGWRYRRHHDGIDVAAPSGTPIQAARDGVVVFAGWQGGYGLAVLIAHGQGVVTLYGHASKILVKIGDQVQQGQVIANVGCTGACTGAHLHFEVRVDGRPFDPLKFLQ